MKLLSTHSKKSILKQADDQDHTSTNHPCKSAKTVDPHSHGSSKKVRFYYKQMVPRIIKDGRDKDASYQTKDLAQKTGTAPQVEYREKQSEAKPSSVVI